MQLQVSSERNSIIFCIVGYSVSKKINSLLACFLYNRLITDTDPKQIINNLQTK